MPWYQGTGTQSPPPLVIWGGLSVLKGEEVVGQGFSDLDCLLLCGARTPNINVGAHPLPDPYTAYA